MAAATQAPAQAGGGGGDGEEMDLTKPGTLWATVEFEGSTTFFLAIDNPAYNEGFFNANGQVDAKDSLMAPFTVSWQDAQKDGMAKCDLAKGRAAEIMGKLSERYERGGPRVEKVKAIYLAKAREGNKIPKAHVAKVKDFKLRAIPTILLSPGENQNDKTHVTVPRFKAGVKEFTVELRVTGEIDEVELRTEPPQDISVTPGGAKAKGKISTKVQEGTTYTIKVAVPLASNMVNRAINHPEQWSGCHPSHCRGNYYRPPWTEQQSLEDWKSTDITLFATAGGKAKGVMKSLKLRAEGWGSGWMSKTPPPGMRHNHC